MKVMATPGQLIEPCACEGFDGMPALRNMHAGRPLTGPPHLSFLMQG